MENIKCASCGDIIPEHEKDNQLINVMSNSDLEDLECIDCEMKFRDSCDIDMF